MSLSVMWHNQQMIHYFGVFSEAVCSNSPFVLKSLVIMRAKKVRRRERPAQETQQNTRLMNISACCGWYIFCSFRFIFFFLHEKNANANFSPTITKTKTAGCVLCQRSSSTCIAVRTDDYSTSKPAEQSSRSALCTRYRVLLFFKNDIYSLLRNREKGCGQIRKWNSIKICTKVFLCHLREMLCFVAALLCLCHPRLCVCVCVCVASLLDICQQITKMSGLPN